MLSSNLCSSPAASLIVLLLSGVTVGFWVFFFLEIYCGKTATSCGQNLGSTVDSVDLNFSNCLG